MLIMTATMVLDMSYFDKRGVALAVYVDEYLNSCYPVIERFTSFAGILRREVSLLVNS